jgi:hypothetical protein
LRGPAGSPAVAAGDSEGVGLDLSSLGIGHGEAESAAEASKHDGHGRSSVGTGESITPGAQHRSAPGHTLGRSGLTPAPGRHSGAYLLS